MNARTETELLEAAAALAPHPMHPHHLSNAHLDALEEETIFILREVAAASSALRCCSPAARTRW